MPRMNADRAGRLRHAFDQQHAGHDRMVGKMTLELRLVEGHVLDADAGFVAADVDDPVDQQKRIAMRQRFQELQDVHRFECSPVV